jgi:hypothetical protein
MMVITYTQREILKYVSGRRRYWYALYRVWGADIQFLVEKGYLKKIKGSVYLSKTGLDAIVTARIICEDKP